VLKLKIWVDKNRRS